MGKSASLKRHIQVYPKPVHYKLLVAESELSEVSKSSIVSEALKQYYDRMEEGERRRLLNAIR